MRCDNVVRRLRPYQYFYHGSLNEYSAQNAVHEMLRCQIIVGYANVCCAVQAGVGESDCKARFGCCSWAIQRIPDGRGSTCAEF